MRRVKRKRYPVVSIDPAKLDSLRNKSGQRIDHTASIMPRWGKRFAEAEFLHGWELIELKDELWLATGDIPVMEMTGAPLVQLFHNPRGKSSSGGGQGHRTEDVALALVHLHWAGVYVPSALPLAAAMLPKLRKKPILTQNELNVLWTEFRDKSAMTIFVWPEGLYPEAFAQPSARLLHDGRLSIRALGSHGGVEAIVKTYSAKLCEALNDQGVCFSKGEIDALAKASVAQVA